MLHWVFVAIASVSAVCYGFSDSVGAWYDIWKLIFVFWGAYLASFILFALLAFIFSRFLSLKPIQKQNKLCRFICHEIGSLLCIFSGARAHITGVDKLPDENTRFMYVCNHIAGYDPLFVMDKLRKYNVSFISKPKNLTIPGLLPISHNAGYLPIDRENNRNGLITITEAIRYITDDICSVGVFPEGTRNRTDELLLPFHAGTFKICKRADCPLVIASIYNANQIIKNLFNRPTHVYLDILEVVPVEKVREMSTRELAEYSREVIRKNLEEKYVGKDLS